MSESFPTQQRKLLHVGENFPPTYPNFPHFHAGCLTSDSKSHGFMDVSHFVSFCLLLPYKCTPNWLSFLNERDWLVYRTWWNSAEIWSSCMGGIVSGNSQFPHHCSKLALFSAPWAILVYFSAPLGVFLGSGKFLHLPVALASWTWELAPLPLDFRMVK